MRNKFLYYITAVVFILGGQFYQVAYPNEHLKTNPSDLSNALSLRIKFLGYADLTGNYLISDDKIVSIPVLGRFSVGKLTTEDFEKLLALKSTKLSKRKTYVSIEILKYRPIYVTGYVTNPGSFQWKPNINVIQALTLSGGIYRETRIPESRRNFTLHRIEVDRAFTRQKQLVADLKIRLSERARLRAELHGEKVVDLPERLSKLVGKSQAQTLINLQNSIMVNRVEAQNSRISLFKRGIEEISEELNSLITQKKLAKRQLKLRLSIMEGIEKLWTQKTINQTRFMEERERVMSVESTLAHIDVRLSNSRGRKLTLERDLETVKRTYQHELLARIAVLDREVEQLEITMETARSAFERLTGYAIMSSDQKTNSITMSSDQKTNSIIKFEIARRDENKTNKITADQFTPLIPGDVLIVSSQSKNPASLN